MKNIVRPANQNFSVTARLSEDLFNEVQALLKATPDAKLSDFVKAAIENEVSRQTLCKPIKEVTLADISATLLTINQRLADADGNQRLEAQILKSIALAVGITGV